MARVNVHMALCVPAMNGREKQCGVRGDERDNSAE